MVKLCEETFVYEGQEIKLTGRIAVRELRNKVQELVEIMPIDGEWKKWVREIDLFKVKDKND